jgi:hypothetical protein
VPCGIHSVMPPGSLDSRADEAGVLVGYKGG